MTLLAVGDASAPQMSPAFVTAARAALLSIAYLRWVGASVPERRHWAPPAVCAAGAVVGFPLCIALALREVESMHAAVVTGIIPLGAAVVGALWLRQRPSAGFWLCALAVIGVVFVSRRLPVGQPQQR